MQDNESWIILNCYIVAEQESKAITYCGRLVDAAINRGELSLAPVVASMPFKIETSRRSKGEGRGCDSNLAIVPLSDRYAVGGVQTGFTPRSYHWRLSSFSSTLQSIFSPTLTNALLQPCTRLHLWARQPFKR